jgi:NitT/TauT family transport system substrate-binding protein
MLLAWWPGLRKIVLLVLAVVVIVLALLAYQSLLMGGGSEKSFVRIGTLRGGISSLDVMRELGLDEKHGFKLEVVLFSKTLDLANALARGDIDIAVIPAEFVAKLREQGTDVVIVAVDFYQNQAVVVRSGVEAKSLEDLYGRRLGVFKPTGTYAMFRAYMKALYGADPEEAFELASMPPPQLVESFQRGDLDAVVIWEPFVSKLVKEYGGRIVVDYTTLWRRWGGPGDSGVMIVYAARGEWARENPELVEKLQKARAEAAREWNNNRELAIRVLQEVYGLTSEAAEYCWERVRMEEAEKLTGILVENIVTVWRLARQGGYIAGGLEDLAKGAFYGAGG